MSTHTCSCTTPQPFYWQNTTSFGGFLNFAVLFPHPQLPHQQKLSGYVMYDQFFFISPSALSPLSLFLPLTLPLSLLLTIIIVKRERHDTRYQSENNSQLKDTGKQGQTVNMWSQT